MKVRPDLVCDKHGGGHTVGFVDLGSVGKKCKKYNVGKVGRCRCLLGSCYVHISFHGHMNHDFPGPQESLLEVSC